MIEVGEKTTLVPTLRFPGFNEEWTSAPISDLLEEHALHSDGQAEVHSVSVHVGVVNQIEHLGRSFAASDTSRYNLARPGDVIYTKSPTGNFPYGIVKQSRLEENAIVSPLYGVFEPVNRSVGYILDSYFESPIRANAFLYPLVQKGAKNTLSITNARFLEGALCLPQTAAEQLKIAQCLESLDELIAAETEKLVALKRHKTGLLEQLFPAEGETTPALRFPKFSDQLGWRTARVDELAIVTGGKRIPKGEGFSARPTDFRYIRVSDLRMGGVDPANVLYITAEIEQSIRAYKIAAGDLYISVAGTIGLVGIVPPELHNANLTENANRIRPTKIDPSFLLHAFTQPSTQSALRRSVTTNAQPKLALDRIRSLELMVPGAEEQVHIATTLNEADALIRSCYELIRDLRLHKSALMQQLFPNVDEVEA